MIGLAFSLLLAAVQTWPGPGQVTSTVDKNADFASIRTYAWEKGLEVFDKESHRIIVAAIDAELASRGMRPAGAGQADVLIRYDGLGSDYVDLDELERARKKDPNALAPTKVMGSLAISMHRAGSTQRMWRGLIREIVDPNAREASIRKIVTRVFGTFPKKPTA
jgi:hypothetical protein